MDFIADLHIHSHYSRATSKELIPENLERWAGIKGITVAGTGDFTHPGWLKELKAPPRKVFVVHGETKSAKSFAEFVESQTGWNVSAPAYNDEVILD